jgi:2-oxoglutarate ferredoxin oxidoreductase subunit delta
MNVEAKEPKENPKIDIYKAWCKGCGICTAFCPAGVLAKDDAGYPYVKNPEKCLNCGWCEMHCPDFAITVEKKKVRKGAGKTARTPQDNGKGRPGEKEA